MELLDFARGPALQVALVIFVAGTLWRLLAMILLPWIRVASEPRGGTPGAPMAALQAIVSKMWPRPAFLWASLFSTANGYVFHIGLALVFFGYAPHIAFIHRITGLSWPALPDYVMYVAAAATIVSLLLALGMRIGSPVRKQISTSDDMITWTITFLPLITGMAVTMEPSASVLAREVVLYRTPLAIHLLSLELLLIWFPFGKLMHAVLFAFSRGATGVRFGHRGVRV